jgi:hypothetical protein
MRSVNAVCVAASFATIASNASCGGPCGIPGPVLIQAHLALAPDALANATVTCCQNTRCASGTFAAAPSTQSSFELTGDLSAFVSADPDDPLAGPGFTEVQIYPRVPPLVLADGDTYSVRIDDAVGSSILNMSKTVASYPSVEECGHGDTEYTDLVLDFRNP